MCTPCKWNIRDGIRQLLKDFSDINLSFEDVNNSDFYRLQHLDLLLTNNFINKNLFWVKDYYMFLTKKFQNFQKKI